MRTATRKIIKLIEPIFKNGIKCHVIDYNDYKYIMKALKKAKGFADFYLTAKVYKNKHPTATRPVAPTQNSKMYGIAKWLDHYLQKLSKYLFANLKDTCHLIYFLNQLSDLPSTTKIFTFDADAMYTNIKTPEGVEQVKRFLDKLDRNQKLLSDFPKKELLKALEIVMNNNIIQFSNSFWIQLSGAAIGIPPTCIYVRIFFNDAEKTLSKKFAKRLLLLKRFVDDGVGLWKLHPHSVPSASTEPELEEFKKELNKASSLNWVCSKLVNKINFLQVIIKLVIKNNKITFEFSPFSKELNLHLYIPANSAHPPGVLKGMINGILCRYWMFSSQKQTYIQHTKDFFKRLIDRGYTINALQPLFLQAASRISSNTILKRKKKLNFQKTLFFYSEYHPKDLTSNKIQSEYKKICHETFS